MPLMTIGLFVFELKTAPFDTTSRQTDQRWSTKDRSVGPPAHQYLGPGTDSLSIDGTLMPELTGGGDQLDKLRDMASEGKAWILVSGDGRNQGKWFIDSIHEKTSHHAENGAARKIDFTLSLKRYWDTDVEAMGNLEDSL